MPPSPLPPEPAASSLPPATPHDSGPAPWRGRAEAWIGRAWQRRGWFAWSMWPASLIFGLLAMLRRAAFRYGLLTQHSAGIPVLVVGNVTVGGTGKTPTVIALISALREAGFTPGVISRGFGGKGRGKVPTHVTTVSDPRIVGDEPALIVQRTRAPMVVCPDRVAAARVLRDAHPEVDILISDDGLQHYRLARDVEIVVFDQRLGGNGFLLPAGPLREPLSRTRDATLINDPDAALGTAARVRPPGADAHLRRDTNTWFLPLRAEVAWRVIAPEENRAIVGFKGADVFAAAGIGSPERFFAMLRGFGLQPRTQALPDHYDFERNPFKDVKADAILITEKDAVKCRGWQDERLWAVPVVALLDPRLIALVVEKVRGRSPA